MKLGCRVCKPCGNQGFQDLLHTCHAWQGWPDVKYACTQWVHGESITDQAPPRMPTQRTFQPQEALQP